MFLPETLNSVLATLRNYFCQNCKKKSLKTKKNLENSKERFFIQFILWTCWLLSWEQWWNFTVKTSVNLCSKMEKKPQIWQSKQSKNSSGKVRCSFDNSSENILTKFEKTIHNLKAKPLKKRLTTKIFSLKGSSEDVESCSRTVVTLASRIKILLKFEKFYKNWKFFKKILRLYLQTCRVLFWQECPKKMLKEGEKNSI